LTDSLQIDLSPLLRSPFSRCVAAALEELAAVVLTYLLGVGMIAAAAAAAAAAATAATVDR
jgi:hypothetical protein